MVSALPISFEAILQHVTLVVSLVGMQKEYYSTAELKQKSLKMGLKKSSKNDIRHL